MNVKVTWLKNVLMVGETDSGHALVMDGPEAHGGENKGPRPMEMLLLGLGGCTEFDVLHILKKSRQSVSSCEVEISAERAETEPKVFTKIHVHFKISGDKLTEKAVERAVSLSAEKYCSASLMLAKTATITHDFEIING